MKKVCTRCKEEKYLDEFSNYKNSKDGKHIYCKICAKNKSKERYSRDLERIKKYREDNKEKLREIKKEYSLKNKEVLNARSKQWNLDNKEYRKEYLKNWNKNNYNKNHSKIRKYQNSYNKNRYII